MTWPELHVSQNRVSGTPHFTSSLSPPSAVSRILCLLTGDCEIVPLTMLLIDEKEFDDCIVYGDEECLCFSLGNLNVCGKEEDAPFEWKLVFEVEPLPWYCINRPTIVVQSPIGSSCMGIQNAAIQLHNKGCSY